MTTKIAAALVMVALVAGCEKRDTDTGALDKDRGGVDTVVQSSSIKDTTVVRADTTIDVDTIKKTDHIDDNKKD